MRLVPIMFWSRDCGRKLYIFHIELNVSGTQYEVSESKNILLILVHCLSTGIAIIRKYSQAVGR